MASGAPVPPAGTSIFPQAWFPYVDIPTSMIPLMPAAYNARKMLCPGCDRDMKLVQTSRNRECCQKSLSSIASAANSRKQLRRSAQPNVLTNRLALPTAGLWCGSAAKALNSAAHRKFFVRRAVGQSSLPEDIGGFPCEIEIFSLMLPLLPQW